MLMKIIIPIVLALVGLGSGWAIVHFFIPAPAACEPPAAGAETTAEPPPAEAPPPAPQYEYADMTDQFVVPIIDGDRVSGTMVLSLSLEVLPGNRDSVLTRQPKLRDEFLRLLFVHSNMGEFAGNFLETKDLEVLRSDLTNAATIILGPVVHSVLITDMIRQDR